MEFRLSDDGERFRRKVSEWLQRHLPAGWGTPTFRAPQTMEDEMAFAKSWLRELNEGGWAGLSWPKEYGGRGASPIEQLIYHEEYARVRAPSLMSLGVGNALVGPTLMQHGTEEQKKRFLPKILSGDEIWCHGFSEPNSGSDLASLRTRAETHGDELVINGQKIWTSYARFAQWCILLVRTDPTAPKHKGITYVLLDMTTLGHERSIGAPHARLMEELKDLIRLAKVRSAAGRVQDPRIRQKIAQHFIETEILRFSDYRMVTQVLRNGQPGPEGSILKLFLSEIDQRMKDTAVEVEGPYSQLVKGSPQAIEDGRWQHELLWSRAATIYAGTSEVQRNIISQRVLGLPRG